MAIHNFAVGGPFGRWKIAYENRGPHLFCQKLESNLITTLFIDYVQVQRQPRRNMIRLKKVVCGTNLQQIIGPQYPFNVNDFETAVTKEIRISIWTQYLFINHIEFKRDSIKRKKYDLLVNPLRKYEAIGRQDLRTVQLATLTGIRLQQIGKCIQQLKWTYTHAHTQQPKTESDVLRRLLGSGVAGTIT